MEEIVNSIKAQLYERIGSPLVSSFVFSWLVWNYKFVLLLISSMEAQDKLMYVEIYSFPDICSVFTRGIAYPLLSSLAIIYLLPIPSRFVYKYTREQQKALKEIQTSIEDDTPVTREEARNLRISLRKLAVENDKEVSELKTEIEDLKKHSEDLVSQVEKLRERNDELAKAAQKTSIRQDDVYKSLNEEEKDLLNRIADSPSGVNVLDLKNQTGFDIPMIGHIIDKLIDQNLVEQLPNKFYASTSLTRRLLTAARIPS